MMRSLRIPLMIVLLAGLPIFSAASSIYFWTDENGVRHYSNTGVPESAVQVEEAPETTVPPEEAASPEETAPAQEGAPSQEAAEESPAAEGDIQNRDAKERRYEDARQSWNNRIFDERDQLQSQIEAIENRAPSRYFTEGMREAQLKPLKDKLGLLNQDPEGYFGQKAPKPEDFGLSTEAASP